MYRNLENVMKPKVMREGKTPLVAMLMALLLGYLVYTLVKDGSTWENDRYSFFLVVGLAVSYVISIPLGRLRAKHITHKQFARFNESQLMRIDMECGEIEPQSNIIVTSHALVGIGLLIPIEDIVWVFVKNSTQQVVATINELVVVTSDKKEHKAPLSIKPGPFKDADKQAVQEIMKQLATLSPGIYGGYTKENVQLYRTDFAKMAENVKVKRRR